MLIYFAYGSNINLAHLRSFPADQDVDSDDVKYPQHAVLPDYRFRTNYLSTVHGAGACNVEPCQEAAVEGVAMEITPTVVDAIRRKEGWSTRYREIEIAVEIASTGEVINAMTYIVTPEHRLSYDLPLSPDYRQLILKGAREFKFSQAYQEWLRVVLRPPANRPVATA